MTTAPAIRKVEIFGQDDEHLVVYPFGQVNRGVYMTEDQVHGIYDTPEKQTWKSSARVAGSKPKYRKILQRDMEVGFTAIETKTHTYEENESYLIQAIGFELDKWDEDARYARMAIHTDQSGVRMLDIVQYEEPDFAPKHDSIKDQLGKPILKLRSGQPDWYEEPVIKSCEWTQDGWNEIEVSNPTNREMSQEWVFTAAPSTASAGIVYTIPDFSWLGKKSRRRPGGSHESRYITSPPITAVQGGLRISLDRTKLMARDFHNTNILALFQGQSFRWRVPAYTQPQMIPVHAANVPDTGAMCQLIQPRLWSRPWGLEHVL